MVKAYRHLNVRRQGEVVCVQLRAHQLSEQESFELGDELADLVADEGCHRLALSLGLDEFCMYSIVLAKLVMTRRRLLQRGGEMRLCDVSPEVLRVLQVCHLHRFFEMSPDLDTAVAELSAS